MPRLSRPDGARIHFEVRGEDGPAIVLASYWSWHPGVYDELLSELAADHRVVTYHLRGSGESSDRGPYDMETDIGDLEAVVDEAGGAAVMIATNDSSNRAAKLAARRTDLISAVVAFGTAPIARSSFAGMEGMLTSDSVVGAYIEMLEHNYRGAIRTLNEATNPQLSEDEMKERVDAQAAFCPQDGAVARVRQWAEDDPNQATAELGDRLWVFTAPDAGGPWLPPAAALADLKEKLFPDAQLVEFEPGTGPISRPHEAAEALRGVTAPLRGAARGRK
jgi:pimeloyl-ACP methyl ester carboxylesterase